MYKIMIFEKESLTARGLKDLVSETSFKVGVECFYSAEDVLNSMKETTFDVFFVRTSSSANDEGVNLAKAIRQIKGYEMAYIIFVIDKEDNEIGKIIQDEFYSYWVLPTPIDKVMEEKFIHTLSIYLANKTPAETDLVTLLNDQGENRVKRSDILFFDIVGKEVTIHLIDGTIDKYPNGYYSLNKMLATLGDGFIQIFKSIVVNTNYIINVKYKEKLVAMEYRKEPLQLGGDKYVTGLKKRFGDSEDFSKKSIETVKNKVDDKGEGKLK